jgi:hypothetical protein
MQGRLLLDVVVGEGAAVLELLAGEDETLLIRGNTFLVLDLCLHVLDGVRRIHIEGDGLAREGLNEDLHARHLMKKAKRVEVGGWVIKEKETQTPLVYSVLKYTKQNTSCIIVGRLVIKEKEKQTPLVHSVLKYTKQNTTSCIIVGHTARNESLLLHGRQMHGF